MSDAPMNDSRALTDFGIDPELVAAPRPIGAAPLRLESAAGVPVFAAAEVEPDAPQRAEDADTANAVQGPAEHVEDSGTEPTMADDEQPSVRVDEYAPSATASAADAGDSATRTRFPRSHGRVRSELPKPKAPRTRRAPKSRVAQARAQRRNAVIARTVGTATAAVTMAAAVWALGWMPLPEQQAQAPAAVITPQPGDQIRVCPGPLQQLGLSSNADAVSSVGEPSLQTASFAPKEPKQAPLGQDGPSSFTVSGMNGDTHSQLGITQGLGVSGKKSSGYSATACSQPAPSQWLLAGNTTKGQNSVLDVINPGNVPARVNFALYTEAGAVRPTIPEAVIKPGERKTVSLAGVAPDAEAIAIKVDATGTPVTAYVHQTAIDTLDPKGSEIANATALPATRQVISGMHVYERPGAGDDAPTTIGSTLRLMNPGEDNLMATVRFLRSNGEATEMEVPLDAGRVTDMPITTLPEGDYTVVVEAETPILAGGRMAPLDGSEFAWLAASPQLQGKTMVAIAQGPNPKLALANPSDTERTLSVNGAQVRVRPRATVYIDEPASTAITLDDADGIYAAVYYSGTGELSATPVLLGNPDATPITVVG